MLTIERIIVYCLVKLVALIWIFSRTFLKQKFQFLKNSSWFGLILFPWSDHHDDSTFLIHERFLYKDTSTGSDSKLVANFNHLVVKLFGIPKNWIYLQRNNITVAAVLWNNIPPKKYIEAKKGSGESGFIWKKHGWKWRIESWIPYTYRPENWNRNLITNILSEIWT